MADDPFDSFRLFLMQDVLPVGIAMFERAKDGGVSKVAEPFASSDDPLQTLRQEGESAAKTVRERLDNVSPGLGNPVVPVKVAVETEDIEVGQTHDDKSLIECLDRINLGMTELEHLLIHE